MQIDELAKIIRESGVVGSGGAGFPSYAKLNEKADTIILNCAECEPLLKLHRQVLQKYAYEIMSTLKLIGETVKADNIIIAIKKSYKDAVESVSSYLDAFQNIKIKYIPEIYPAGDEVVTIYETTGRVVPPGQIPISVGVTVFNVETVYNIYNAVNNNVPVTHKYVTITGEVENGVTLKLPVGCKVSDAVKLAGGALCDKPAYIMGGPMTGRLVTPNDVITKTTNAILVLPNDHYVIQKRKSNVSVDMKRAMASCCQCQMCTDMCPRYLLGHPIEPHLFMRNATSGIYTDTNSYINTMFCSQCGLCEMFSCTQGLAPKSLMGVCKDELRKNGVKVPTEVETVPVRKERDYRKVPMKRLVSRLGLKKYDKAAPLTETEVKVKEYKVMLSQGIGAPAETVVKKGEKVEPGQLIAKYPEKGLGVSLHSPCSGKILEITDKFVLIRV